MTGDGNNSYLDTTDEKNLRRVSSARRHTSAGAASADNSEDTLISAKKALEKISKKQRASKKIAECRVSHSILCKNV